MASLSPEVLWAQRADVLYLTVNLTDIKDQTIQLEKNKLHFKGKGEVDQKTYEFELEFYDEVDPEKSKQNLTPRNLVFIVQKAKDSWWPRLNSKSNSKPHWLKTDFEKWKEEDDEEEEEAAGSGGGNDFNNMDFSSILQNSGMGGMGGAGPGGFDPEDEGDDSDEEGMPDLEEAAPK